MAPSNGTPAMAPSNGTQREPAKVGSQPPLLLEVRTPIAKAIWGKKKYYGSDPSSTHVLDLLCFLGGI